MELMIYHDDEEKTARSRIEKMIQLSRSNIVIFFCEEARRAFTQNCAGARVCVYIYIRCIKLKYVSDTLPYISIDVAQVGKGEIMRVGKRISLDSGLISLFIFKLDLVVDVRRERANVFNMLLVIICTADEIQRRTSTFANKKASAALIGLLFYNFVMTC